MSSLKKIFLGILIFILILFGIMIFLISTNNGLHILFHTANHLISGLEIGHISGGWRNLSLKKICYDQSGISINVGEFYLSVDLNSLYKRSICIDNISLKDVNVSIDLEKRSALDQVKNRVAKNSLLNILSLFPIVLNWIEFNNINVDIDHTNISLMYCISKLSFSWKEKNLNLSPTILNGLIISIPKETKKSQKKENFESKIYKLPSKWRSNEKILRRIFSTPILSEIISEYLHIPFNFNIEELKGNQLQITSGTVNLAVHKILIRFSNINRDIYLETLHIDSKNWNVNAVGHVRLQDNYPVDFAIKSSINTDFIRDEEIELIIRGSLYQSLEMTAHFFGPINMTLCAQTFLSEIGLPIKIEIVGKQLFWPFFEKEKYKINGLKLKIIGKITDYNLSFCTLVKSKDVPITIINLNAKGNDQQIYIDKLIILALGGKVEVTTVINWTKTIRWHGKLKINRINMSNNVSKWSSKLDGIIETRGSIYGNLWEANISKLKIIGNIRNNKVNIEGAINGNSLLQWDIPRLHFSIGNNSLNLKGKIDITDLNFSTIINAQNLNSILPNLYGTTKGLIELKGTIKDPQLSINISSKNLRWKKFHASYIHVKSNVKSDNQISGRLNVLIEDIPQSGITSNLLKLDVDGNEKKHDVKLYLQSRFVSGNLHLMGNFDRCNGHWKSQLDNAFFYTMIGPWKLTRSISIDYFDVEKIIRIGPHCWNNPNAELHIPQIVYTKTQGIIQLNLNHFNLIALKPLISNITTISGMCIGKVNITWDTLKNSFPQGGIELSGSNIKIDQSAKNDPLPVVIDRLKIQINLHNSCVKIGWFIQFIKNGQFNGIVQVNDLTGRRNFSGNVDIHNLNLSMANKILFRGEKAIGILNASLKLSGNAKHPQIFGRLKLDNISFEGNFLPFDMKPSQILMRFHGNQSILQGTINSYQGLVEINGKIIWNQINDWYAYVIAKGDEVRITVPSIARLNISPNLVLEAAPNILILKGQIGVPWGRIMMRKLPESTVGISSDAVILNNDLKFTKEKSSNIVINSNLIVHIGNNVKIDAFGLKAKLTGDLKLSQDKKGLGLNGQISIPEGRFYAYGQDFLVRRGELLFSGPPDQTLLNIEAVRNTEFKEGNIITGVRVTGTPNEPKVEVFSEPEVSQIEALSYLLRGKNLGSSSQKDSEVMTSMLVGIGVAQSSQVVGKIGETFGVKNLTVYTKGIGNSSQIVISGYILPRLQIKYGLKIFDSIATFTLRYRLMPNLYLETIHGLDQTLDLLYQFDF